MDEQEPPGLHWRAKRFAAAAGTSDTREPGLQIAPMIEVGQHWQQLNGPSGFPQSLKQSGKGSPTAPLNLAPNLFRQRVHGCEKVEASIRRGSEHHA